MTHIARRSIIRFAGASAAVGVLRPRHGLADDKAVTIGIDLSLTGADAETAVRIRDGFMLAIDEANAKGGAGGGGRMRPRQSSGIGNRLGRFRISMIKSA